MRSKVVAVRCFAEQTAGRWEARCVDLDLTVRGESLDAVKCELDRLIHESIDAAAIRRRSIRCDAAAARGPLHLRLKYWGLRLAGRLGWREDALRSNRQGARHFEPRVVPRPAR
ncbi:MAG: hypothetical protein ABI920_01650 [Casimicrobiaceae bacterium]